jgi:hypothetical protein
MHPQYALVIPCKALIGHPVKTEPKTSVAVLGNHLIMDLKDGSSALALLAERS